jgi:hypothetical protein
VSLYFVSSELGTFLSYPFSLDWVNRISFSLSVRRLEMSSNTYGSYEANDFEDLMESDGTFEEEWESGDFEDEMDPFDMEDPDPFLGDVFRAIPGPVRGALKGLARQGAAWAGSAIGGQRGARIGQNVADTVIRNLNFEVGDMEEESEVVSDLEAMGADTQILQEMSHLATLAANARSDGEADEFLGAIAGLAGKILPQVLGGLAGGDGEEESYDPERDEFFPALLPLAAQALPMAMPLISKGIGAVGRLFSRKRRTRRLMETLPPIAAKSTAEVLKKAQAGRPITPKTVAGVVAKQIAKTVATKPAVAKALQANKEMAYGGRPGSYNRQAYGYSGSQQRSPYAGYGRARRRIVRPRYCVY